MQHIETLEQRLKNHPQDNKMRLELALHYWEHEQFDVARAVMHEAPSTNWVEEVALWEVSYWLFQLYELRGEEVFGYQSAFDDVQIKFKNGTQLAEDYYERGHLRLLLQDMERALADLEQATKLYPKMGVYWYEKGKIRRELGHYAVALANLNRAIKLSPEVSFYYERGNIFYEMGHYHAAVADFDEAISGFPTSVLAYSMRARAKYGAHDFGGALADVRWLQQRFGNDQDLDWFVQDIEQRMNGDFDDDADE